MENFPKEKGEKGEKKSSRLTLDFLPTQESSSFEFLSCISYALLATRTMIPVWLVRFSHSVNTTPSFPLLFCFYATSSKDIGGRPTLQPPSKLIRGPDDTRLPRIFQLPRKKTRMEAG